MEFAYAGGGLGKGGQVTLYVDGKKVGEGSVPMTQAVVFSADDGCFGAFLQRKRLLLLCDSDGFLK
jgi:hypothetical protein